MTRLLSGMVLLLAVGSAAWFAPTAALLLLALAIALGGFVEFARLADALGARVPRVPGFLLTAALCAVTALRADLVLPAAVAALVVAAVTAVFSGTPHRGRLAGVAAMVFAPFYLGLPLGSLIAVHGGHGREAAFLLLLTIIASDSSQYYAGRLFGRHLLAPAISPKKTIEGAVGGFAGGAFVMAWLGGYWLPQLTLELRVLLGIALVFLGIVGDLFESVIKRAADVKDSSALIPGHGGVLDRIDAFLLAAPVYFVVLRYATMGVR